MSLDLIIPVKSVFPSRSIRHVMIANLSQGCVVISPILKKCILNYQRISPTQYPISANSDNMRDIRLVTLNVLEKSTLNPCLRQLSVEITQT